MPKLWNETIEAHRRTVRETTLDVTAALVAAHGPVSVTMSQIAGAAGIGRATLYKYFPDVESVLAGWYEREVTAQLARLTAVRNQEQERTRERRQEPGRLLGAVLLAYAVLVREQPPGLGVGALPEAAGRGGPARRQLLAFLAGLLAEAAASGAVRDDVAPGELADYCLHALGAAAGPLSMAAVERLVAVTLAGLRPTAG
ncbi:TetR/AcrR family transcriptional regulator [Streptacidiphilus sp. P02-A3a]|uniref:TetR/AcrR family transcriptional regulator n=1 Tax=Streptacidiphilus sp. P02-A3a TaxID=2704468 RepID=UPI0015FBBF2B|nr:TetR/AcrR family transcriptional regulator [Streptacidiphilus sp. P02-A3a]QMU71028.1 TetR/AcrR family transcriptional regulator [Streptacidiphilus sp. P02-A3a]